MPQSTLTKEVKIEWRAVGSTDEPNSLAIGLDYRGKVRCPDLFGPESQSNPRIAVRGDIVTLQQKSILGRLPVTMNRFLHPPIANKSLDDHPEGVEFTHLKTKRVSEGWVSNRFSFGPEVSQLHLLLHDSAKQDPAPNIEMVITRQYR
jgi:hypothetical protein